MKQSTDKSKDYHWTRAKEGPAFKGFVCHLDIGRPLTHLDSKNPLSYSQMLNVWLIYLQITWFLWQM